jgi:peroxiredoxin Q/BCP
VLGVSGDTLETHRQFSKEFNITFPLIDDADGAVRKLYGGGRVTYLIDAAGTIRHVMKGVPDNPRLLEELDRLPQ